MPATFSGTTKANNVRQFGDEAIRDTMRINDDGSLRIPNVNREKHQGIWRCRHHHTTGANSSSGSTATAGKKNQVYLVKLSVSSRKRSQANKQNRERIFFYISLITFLREIFLQHIQNQTSPFSLK